ncbi:MAG TPA: FG-GAP-like repeat-containing protein [Pyrinomonadaceae bacterium]|nr:FG-GAP-like repeat-containing protein [Pyrinomonadaceae bacterium]
MKYFSRKTRHLRQNFLFGFLAIGLFLVLPALTFAAPGDLDLSFGSGGKVITPIGSSFDYANSVAIQMDGKIVAAGYSQNGANADFAVVRYNTDGTLDTSFGGTGKVVTPIGSSSSYANSVAIQSDGKIVAAGYSRGVTDDFAVVRYNTNGTLDTSFNGTGKVITQVGSSGDYAFSVAIQSDGKIVAAGSSSNGTKVDFAVVRYNTDGSLDTSFNGTGKVVTAVGSSSYAASVAIQSDGKIVAAGNSSANANSTNADFAVVRYNPNGSLDTSFNGTGKVVTPIGSSSQDAAASVAIQADGKIVAAGDSRGADFNFAVVRYNTNGTLDTSFGGTGKVVTAVGSRGDRASSVAIQPDGKIVAAGRSSNGSDHDFALVRYLADSNSNVRTRFDFDGDGRADISVFRPSNGVWSLRRSSLGISDTQFGLSTDKITPADFDGDGKTDIAVFRDGNWYWLNSSNGSFQSAQFGQAGDIPVPADYTGDGRAELAVYRVGTWYTLNLANNQFNAVQFGIATDKPVVGDYDGDGRADYAVYRDDTWYLLQSTQGFGAIQFGISTDKLVPADYDGDGKTDVAVFRDGTWYLLGSQRGFTAFPFGFASDIPAPADYDGDGKADVAVFRDGTWYLQQSTNGFSAVQFGLAADKPVPTTYLP